TPFKSGVERHATVIDHGVKGAERISRSGVPGGQTRERGSRLRNNAGELARCEESARDLVVGGPAAGLFEDHREHDVVRVRVVPAFAGSKWWRRIKQVGQLLNRRPRSIRRLLQIL